ncbi:MAG: hypothetical protein N2202_02285 [Proteobacteria bacterium]|nr:hypothetical protein [Pseudomonadota bacterium]
MLVIMEATATQEDIERVKEYLISKNFDIHQSTGMKHVIIGVIGDVIGFDATELENMSGVQQVVKITEYKKRG